VYGRNGVQQVHHDLLVVHPVLALATGCGVSPNTSTK
jgi:hypothetical protein